MGTGDSIITQVMFCGSTPFVCNRFTIFTILDFWFRVLEIHDVLHIYFLLFTLSLNSIRQYNPPDKVFLRFRYMYEGRS